MKTATVALLAALFFTGCGMFTTKLTDDLVAKYSAAFTGIKTAAPEAARDLKGGGLGLESLKANKAAFEKIQEEVKKAGFADLNAFLKVHTSIQMAFLHVEADGGMKQFGNIKNAGLEMLDKQIADPGTPADVKESLKKQRDDIVKSASKNEAMAGKVMGVLDKMADPDNLAVVARHRSALKKLYLGL